MTYQEHLNSLISPVQSFFDWFTQITNSLLRNYFVIDMLGFVLIGSLLFLLINILLNYIHKKNDDLEKKQSRYDSYALFQEAKNEFMKKNPSLYYENKYKDYVFQKSIQKDYRRNLLSNEENISKSQDKIFSHWKDKSTGEPLSPEEEKEINDLLDNF